MPQISFNPNRAYPSIPTVGEDLQSHSRAIEAIREAVMIHERRTKDVLESFVRVNELVTLGLIDLEGNVVSDSSTDTDGSGTHHHDSLYIRLDGASPGTTGLIDFGAGIEVTGGVAVLTGDVVISAGELTADALNVGPIGLEDITTGGASGATLVGMAALPGASNGTVQEAVNIFGSAGVATGGEITDSATANAVDVAAGSGYIRATNIDGAELVFFDWSASPALNIPTGTVRYIGIDYNAGTPVVVTKVTDTWNYRTEFPLGLANNDSGTLHITEIPWHVCGAVRELIEHIDAIAPVYRDERVSGLILGETGTRNIQVTAGNLMVRVSQFPFATFDSSGADSFTTVYRDGIGGFTETLAVSQWPNLQYDDGTGVLATLGTNKYANVWFYVGVDGDVYCVYGTAQHANVGVAETEAPPSDLPGRFSRHVILIGRLTFQEGDATAAVIVTAFDTVFTAASVSDHGSLGGLADDDHTQYFLADGTRPLDGTLTIRDATLADSAAFSHNGADFISTFVNTTWHRVNGLASGMLFNDGAEIRMYDATNTDFIRFVETGTSAVIHANNNPLYIQISGQNAAKFDGTTVQVLAGRAFRIYDSTGVDYVASSHDGIDFNIVGTNTTDINVTGIISFNVPLLNGSDPTDWDTAYGWGDHAGLYLPIAGEAASASTVRTNPSAINADYKVTFALTTGNIAGLYSSMMDDTATFTYNPSTNILKLGAVEATGAVTGSNLNISDWDTAFGWGDHSSGGYLQNVVEDTTPEFSSNLNMRTGAEIWAYDSTNVEYLRLTSQTAQAVIHFTANNFYLQHDGQYILHADGSNVSVRARAFRVYDSTVADYANFQHDGVDFNTTFVGTTDWNVTVATLKLDGVLQIDDPGSTSFANFTMGPNTLIIGGTGLAFIQVENGIEFITRSGGVFSAYEAANINFISMEHDGTDGRIFVDGTGGIKLDADYVQVIGYIDMGVNLVTDTKVGQWDTAYGWGDPSGIYLPIAGEAASASTVRTAPSALNADYKVTFALTTGNSSGLYSSMMDDTATFTYNPSTNILKLGTVETASGDSDDWNTAFGWGDWAGHTHTFSSLTSKTGGTSDYLTSGDFGSGEGSGGVAMTINDGYGNANLTFNHRNGTPDNTNATQSAGRIECATDSNTASMVIELGNSTSDGVPVALNTIMTLTISSVAIAVPLTASSFGGVASANLVDKAAAEIVSGLWIFSYASDPSPTAGQSALTSNFLHIDGKEAIDGNDSWLRLNQHNEFSSGVYIPYVLRVDGSVTFNGNLIGDGASTITGIETITIDSTGRLQFGDTTSYVMQNDAIRLGTDHGYVDIGPLNASYCHFNTNIAGGFYFYDKLTMASDIVPSAANAQDLGSTSLRWNQVHTTNVEFAGTTDSTLSRAAAGVLQVENQAIASHESTTYNSAKINFSTSAPSGGSDGDIWFEYT